MTTVKHTLLQIAAAIALIVSTVDNAELVTGAKEERLELHELAGRTEESSTEPLNTVPANIAA